MNINLLDIYAISRSIKFWMGKELIVCSPLVVYMFTAAFSENHMSVVLGEIHVDVELL